MRFLARLLIALPALPLMGGSIEGRVTNSVTGEGVVGASVRFLDRHSYVYENVHGRERNVPAAQPRRRRL